MWSLQLHQSSVDGKREDTSYVVDSSINLSTVQSKHNSNLFDENISIFNFNHLPKLSKVDYDPISISEFVGHEEQSEDELLVFEGTLINKQKTGLCRLVYQSGLYIEANFREGLMEGEGYMTLPSGIEYSGIFRKGLLEKHGMIGIEGNYHKGKFHRGIFQGDTIFSNHKNQHF